jgi:hypothetical protein
VERSLITIGGLMIKTKTIPKKQIVARVNATLWLQFRVAHSTASSDHLLSFWFSPRSERSRRGKGEKEEEK